MTNDNKMRSSLGRVRGLGSAKHGTSHWWGMKLTSLALILLCGWFVAKLVWCLQDGNYAMAVEWLKQPLSAGMMVLFLLTGFHHAAAGLQTVLEDYVHCELSRRISIIAVQFIAAILAVTGIIAVGKIVFGA